MIVLISKVSLLLIYYPLSFDKIKVFPDYEKPTISILNKGKIVKLSSLSFA
jgi:hypothetical protein